jgi:hypothetical protein
MNRTGWWLILRPPEPVKMLVAALQEASLFPKVHTWWFAWNALEIVLPRLLDENANLDGDWEVLRIFSEQAELRVERRGGTHGCWLLLEREPEEALGVRYQEWVKDTSGPYTVEDGYHLLAGRKLELPDEDERGEILYPRTLDYGVGRDELSQALVATVRNYYDEAHRLISVRYATLQAVAPGSIPVQPFPDPDEVLSLLRDEARGGD